MNGKMAKMLRKTNRTSKKDKRWLMSLNQKERADVRHEYMELRNKGNEC